MLKNNQRESNKKPMRETLNVVENLLIQRTR